MYARPGSSYRSNPCVLDRRVCLYLITDWLGDVGSSLNSSLQKRDFIRDKSSHYEDDGTQFSITFKSFLAYKASIASSSTARNNFLTFNPRCSFLLHLVNGTLSRDDKLERKIKENTPTGGFNHTTSLWQVSATTTAWAFPLMENMKLSFERRNYLFYLPCSTSFTI